MESSENNTTGLFHQILQDVYTPRDTDVEDLIEKKRKRFNALLDLIVSNVLKERIAVVERITEHLLKLLDNDEYPDEFCTNLDDYYMFLKVLYHTMIIKQHKDYDRCLEFFRHTDIPVYKFPVKMYGLMVCYYMIGEHEKADLQAMRGFCLLTTKPEFVTDDWTWFPGSLRVPFVENTLEYLKTVFATHIFRLFSPEDKNYELAKECITDLLGQQVALHCIKFKGRCCQGTFVDNLHYITEVTMTQYWLFPLLKNCVINSEDLINSLTAPLQLRTEEDSKLMMRVQGYLIRTADRMVRDTKRKANRHSVYCPLRFGWLNKDESDFRLSQFYRSHIKWARWVRLEEIDELKLDTIDARRYFKNIWRYFVLNSRSFKADSHFNRVFKNLRGLCSNKSDRNKSRKRVECKKLPSTAKKYSRISCDDSSEAASYYRALEKSIIPGVKVFLYYTDQFVVQNLYKRAIANCPNKPCEYLKHMDEIEYELTYLCLHYVDGLHRCCIYYSLYKAEQLILKLKVCASKLLPYIRRCSSVFAIDDILRYYELQMLQLQDIAEIVELQKNIRVGTLQNHICKYNPRVEMLLHLTYEENNTYLKQKTDTRAGALNELIKEVKNKPNKSKIVVSERQVVVSNRIRANCQHFITSYFDFFNGETTEKRRRKVKRNHHNPFKECDCTTCFKVKNELLELLYGNDIGDKYADYHEILFKSVRAKELSDSSDTTEVFTVNYILSKLTHSSSLTQVDVHNSKFPVSLYKSELGGLWIMVTNDDVTLEAMQQFMQSIGTSTAAATKMSSLNVASGVNKENTGKQHVENNMQESYKSIKEALETLTKKHEQLMEDYNKETAEVKELRKLKVLYDELQSKVARNEKASLLLKNKQEHLTAKTKEAEEVFIKKTAEAKKLKAFIVDAQIASDKVISELKGRYVDSQAKLKEAGENVAKRTNEVKKLKASAEEAASKCTKAEKCVAELRLKHQELGTKVKTLEESLREFKGQSNDFEQELSDKMAANAKLTDELAKLREVNETLVEENRKLVQSASDNEQEQQDKDALIQELVEEIRKVKAENANGLANTQKSMLDYNRNMCRILRHKIRSSYEIFRERYFKFKHEYQSDIMKISAALITSSSTKDRKLSADIVTSMQQCVHWLNEQMDDIADFERSIEKEFYIFNLEGVVDLVQPETVVHLLEQFIRRMTYETINLIKRTLCLNNNSSEIEDKQNSQVAHELPETFNQKQVMDDSSPATLTWTAPPQRPCSVPNYMMPSHNYMTPNLMVPPPPPPHMWSKPTFPNFTAPPAALGKALPKMQAPVKHWKSAVGTSHFTPSCSSHSIALAAEKEAVDMVRADQSLGPLLLIFQKEFPNQSVPNICEALLALNDVDKLGFLMQADVRAKLDDYFNKHVYYTEAWPYLLSKQCVTTRKLPDPWEPDWAMRKQESCTICNLNLNTQDTLKLHCAHVFHKLCLEKWFNKEATCPTCKRFTIHSLHP